MVFQGERCSETLLHFRTVSDGMNLSTVLRYLTCVFPFLFIISLNYIYLIHLVDLQIHALFVLLFIGYLLWSGSAVGGILYERMLQRTSDNSWGTNLHWICTIFIYPALCNMKHSWQFSGLLMMAVTFWPIGKMQMNMWVRGWSLNAVIFQHPTVFCLVRIKRWNCNFRTNTAGSDAWGKKYPYFFQESQLLRF